jgi:putative 4-mercaptohistidine N1-methyltranferase
MNIVMKNVRETPRESEGQHDATDAITGTSDHRKGNVYETTGSLNMYLGLHYPRSGNDKNMDPIFPHEHATWHAVGFPQRVAQILVSLLPKNEDFPKRALDIGCAVGGSSFELAKVFHRVDAFDFSESFVNAAKRMQANEMIRFNVPVEAELSEEVTAMHDEDVTEEVRQRVHFFTGDACSLQDMVEKGLLSGHETYDGVLLANLLCRLPDPMACLNDLSQIVRKEGVVVIVTPYSWLCEFTPRERWLGGFTDPHTNESVYSKSTLQTVMESDGFEKIHEEQVPLIIREHQRKYQYIVSEATGWRKVK